MLKLLQKSYAGKVKLIYIDPRLQHWAKTSCIGPVSGQHPNYLELTGQRSRDDGISSNTGRPAADV